MNLKQGTLLQGGRYRIEKVLGQGGFGITYLAEQTSLNDKVAIKEFFMKEHCNRNAGTSQVTVGSTGSHGLVENFRNKFIKEARNIRKLRHHNIVNIIDVFEENGTAYYVMEYLEGGNLDSRVKSNGPLDEATAVACIRQVADALAEVHSNKLLHLDLKPENIMLNGKGEAVLIDFGIAKHYDDSGAQTTSGLVGLSDGYAPMEQYKKGGVSSFSPATDIYSLGATLFRLITGNKPPHASDVNDDGLPALPDGISPAVRGAIEAAMQPKRKERPQSIEEFLSLLDGAKIDTNPVKPTNDGETEIVFEPVTIVETPVVPQEQDSKESPVTNEQSKVKWIDFEEFCDTKGYPLKKMKQVDRIFPFIYTIWAMTLICLVWFVIDMGYHHSEPFSSKIGIMIAHYDSREMIWYAGSGPGPVYTTLDILSIISIIPFLLFLRLKLHHRINVININNVQDTLSSIKLIQSKDALLGLSLWEENKSRSLLGMKYSNIARINDDTFICTRNGLHGVYNATKKKMLIPVSYESIKLQDGKIVATRGGVVSVFTDHGYRVVE